MTEENVGDFYTINISCPNVHGGENFGEPARFEALMQKLFTINTSKPVYAKMPINISREEFNKLLEVLDKFPEICEAYHERQQKIRKVNTSNQVKNLF